MAEILYFIAKSSDVHSFGLTLFIFLAEVRVVFSRLDNVLLYLVLILLNIYSFFKYKNLPYQRLIIYAVYWEKIISQSFFY